MLLRTLCLCIAALVLPSCVYIQRYPETWPPPLSIDAGCPNIAGYYDNNGEDANGDKKRLSVGLFPSWEMIYNRSITNVEINQEDNELVKVILWSRSAIVSERIYLQSKGEFTCESGSIVIDQPAHRALSKFLLGTNWGWDRLSKNHTGDLILRKKVSGIGLFAVIPIAEVDWLWLRFKHVERKANAN